MILTNQSILKSIKNKEIIIEPFELKFLKTTSYDIHLNRHLLTYDSKVLDVKKNNKSHIFEIPKEGFILEPNRLYLASTKEYIQSSTYVPFIQGRSGVARLGIFIHITAPKGDLHYGNHWTLELHVVQSIRIYSEMPIGQVMFYKTSGEKINHLKSNTYISSNSENPSYPIPSKLHELMN